MYKIYMFTSLESRHAPSLRFQAHLAFPQGLPSIQKCQKSLQARPTPTHSQKDSAAKIKDRLTNDKNGQLVTSGIKHWGLGGYSSVLPRIKFGVTGQDSSPQSPTISYRQPLGPIAAHVIEDVAMCVYHIYMGGPAEQHAAK